MSFSANIKEELTGLTQSKRNCCQLAELAAMARIAGTMILSGKGKVGFRFDLETEAVAQRVFALATAIYGNRVELAQQELDRFARQYYAVEVCDTAGSMQLLTDIGIIRNESPDLSVEPTLPEHILRKTCCRRAFLRGAFLVCGFATDPNRAYQIEYLVREETMAALLMEVLEREELTPHLSHRKELSVVYLKEGEQVSHLLALMGADNAVLEFESIRVEKEINNQVNRIFNMDTANINKVTKSSEQHIDDILYLEQCGQFPKLSRELRQIAELRLDHPESSLQELADMLPDVGKSGVNHRLRKIGKLAKELREKRSVPQ